MTSPLHQNVHSLYQQEEVLGLGGDDSSDDEEVEEYRQRLRQLRRHGVKEGFQSDSDSEDEGAKKDDGMLDVCQFSCFFPLGFTDFQGCQ